MNVLVRKQDTNIREIKRAIPERFRGINFVKKATLVGQQITLGNSTTGAVQERLNKAKGAWKLIKYRAFLDNEVKIKYGFSYGILQYIVYLNMD